MYTVKKTGRTWLAAILSVAMLLAVVTPVHAEGAASWRDAKGKSAQERLAVYERIPVDPAYLYLGKVVSDDPMAVVTHYDESDLRRTAVIRVWTGEFSRHENDLQMTWDDLTYQADGTLVQAVPDLEAFIPDYFLESNQKNYHIADYLGILPWVADIPTDSEAAARGLAKIEDMKLYNMYGIQHQLPEGVEIDYGDPGAVKLHTRVPDPVNAIDLPVDAAGSWAKDYIIHLYKLGIVTGYPDKTIRPERTLTRSEFIAMLTRALELPLDEVTEYGDVVGTWVQEEVAAAERAGIIPRGSETNRFRPNDEITRVEMIEMIYHAVSSYGIEPRVEKINFSDVSNLNVIQREALEHTTQIGIIAGYSDGTFRPYNKLQRAEAFKVLSVLLQLI